jgi:cyclopropane fatty-acyl-phospholipid synthase-like methyltransferase
LLSEDFDKFKYYGQAVQSPDADAEFLSKTYQEIKGKKATVMREDFCAAFALCCEWVKLDPNYKAIGIDLDEECLNYGTSNYLSRLTDEEKSRVNTIKDDVLKKDHPKADLICALNFSYFGFKKRPALKEYFESVYANLEDDGVFIMDCFGGPDCHEPNEHETEHDNFSYYWDQDSFDPLTHEAQFYIHFKRKGEKRREQVFSYDWRLWSLAEIKDLLEEVGFKKVHFYWEGNEDDGSGNGVFEKVTKGELCEAWVAYVVGEK